MSASHRYSQPQLFQRRVEPRKIGLPLTISIALHAAILTGLVVLRPVARLEAPRASTVIALVAPPLTLREPPRPIRVVNHQRTLEPAQFELPPVEPDVTSVAPKTFRESAPLIVAAVLPLAPVVERFEPPPLEALPQEKVAGFAITAPAVPNLRAKLRVSAGGFSSGVSQTAVGRPRLTSQSAGFGSIGRRGPDERSNGARVASNGGFGAVEAGNEHSAVLMSPEVQPIDTKDVKIVSKPQPRYTDAARTRKIEGEVVFDLVFQMDGRVRIVQLVRGLGFGLDETAREAALGIGFEPATRLGSAIDTAARVSISFRMAY